MDKLLGGVERQRLDESITVLETFAQGLYASSTINAVSYALTILEDLSREMDRQDANRTDEDT